MIVIVMVYLWYTCAEATPPPLHTYTLNNPVNVVAYNSKYKIEKIKIIFVQHTMESDTTSTTGVQ